jgi:hypothetical protein
VGADAGPGVDAGTTTGIALRTYNHPPGTTHVTAYVYSSSSYFNANSFPLSTSEGAPTIIPTDAGSNFKVLITSLIVDAGKGRLLATGATTGVTIPQGSLAPLDVTLQPLSRVTNNTPDAAAQWQPFYFDETIALAHRDIASSGYYRRADAGATFSNETTSGITLTNLSATTVDAGLVRYRSTSAINLEPGAYRFQLRLDVTSSVVPSFLGYAYAYIPDTEANEPLDTITVSDASAATIDLTVSGIPSGATHLIAAIDADGGTARTNLAIPFDAGTGASSIGCAPFPDYRVRVAAFAVDGGTRRLVAAGIQTGVVADGGPNPLALAIAPVARTVRTTPETTPAYSAFLFDETFATEWNAVLDIYGYCYIRSSAFTNDDIFPSPDDQNTSISASVVDAGLTRFVSSTSNWASPGMNYYQLRIGVESALEPGGSATFYFPDTASAPLETLTGTAASAVVTLTVTGVPDASTHVVAWLGASYGQVQRTHLDVPIVDAGIAQVDIGCSPGSGYTLTVAAANYVANFGRLLAGNATAAQTVTIPQGASSRSIALIAPTRMTRGTPTCVDAGSLIAVEESFNTPLQNRNVSTKMRQRR